MKERFLAVSVLVLFSFLPVLAPDALAWSGRVQGVRGTDSIVVEHDGQSVTVRLYGIGTPGIRELAGDKAKVLLARLVSGKVVEVEEMGIDSFDRLEGIITVDQQSVHAEMLRQGYAWVDASRCGTGVCDSWAVLEREARVGRRGLWEKVKLSPQAQEWRWHAQEANPPPASTAAPAPTTVQPRPPAGQY